MDRCNGYLYVTYFVSATRQRGDTCNAQVGHWRKTLCYEGRHTFLYIPALIGMGFEAVEVHSQVPVPIEPKVPIAGRVQSA
jgi:hypothetical protein